MKNKPAPPEGGRDAWARDQMQKIARLVDEELPDRWGFAIFTFPLGNEPGRLNYIAKGNRQDIIATLKDWLSRTGGSVEGHQ